MADIVPLLQKAPFEPNGKVQCLFGIAKRFLKLLWICSGRIRQACAYHKITAHWFLFDCRSRSQIDSVNARQSEIFTEFGGGTRAPFSNSGWKSSLTEDSLPVDGLI